MFGGARSWNWLAIKRFAPVSRATRLMYSSELFETIYRKYQINGHKMGITVRIIRSNGRWFSLFCTIPVAMLKNSYFTINLLFMALPCGACLPAFFVGSVSVANIKMFEHLLFMQISCVKCTPCAQNKSLYIYLPTFRWLFNAFSISNGYNFCNSKENRMKKKTVTECEPLLC